MFHLWHLLAGYLPVLFSLLDDIGDISAAIAITLTAIRIGYRIVSGRASRGTRRGHMSACAQHRPLRRRRRRRGRTCTAPTEPAAHRPDHRLQHTRPAHGAPVQLTPAPVQGAVEHN